MNSEKWIENKLRVSILIKGGLCVKLSAMHFTGIPDRLVLLPGGRICFVETKTKGKKPTAMQLKVHAMLSDLGFTTHVIDTEEKLKSFLHAI